MSNVGRPRTGLRPCPQCGSKDRDSNGQCHCRNVFYRARQGAPKAIVDKALAFYNSALKANKGNVEKSLVATREEFPSLAKAKGRTKTDSKKVGDALVANAKAQQKAAAKAEAEAAETVPEKKPVKKGRYVLVIDDFEETDYARKDAAIRNGVRSERPWTVSLNGKVVAASDDLI